jgi:hypothetical protein
MSLSLPFIGLILLACHTNSTRANSLVMTPCIPTNRVSITDTTFYYDEDGNLLRSKMDSGRRKTYVIRTCKDKDGIYTRDERKQDENGTGPARVIGIRCREAKRTKDSIIKGHVESDFVKSNIIEIVDKDILQKMSDSIDDDGGKGNATANNREYGGRIDPDGTINLVLGDPGTPGKEDAVWIDIKGTNTWHSHPSGASGDGAEEQPQKVGNSGTVTNGGGGSNYMQGPSLRDQNRASFTLSYVFAMRTGIIYIYNNSGVVATISLSLVRAGLKTRLKQ